MTNPLVPGSAGPRTSLARVLALFVLLACAAEAQERPLPDRPAPVQGERVQGENPPRDVRAFHLGKDGLALDGYDPVAYFAVGGGKPRKGDAQFELVHEGVRYRFASEANRARFRASPAQFEPAYGGWCAYAMAKREKVEIDPQSFLVHDGRLMLFYKGWLNDTRAKFLKDPRGLTKKADEKWAELRLPPKPR